MRFASRTFTTSVAVSPRCGVSRLTNLIAEPDASEAAVTEAVNERFAPVRARRAELAADPGYARRVLRDGCDRARAVAAATRRSHGSTESGSPR